MAKKTGAKSATKTAKPTTTLAAIYTTGFRFENGHVVGPSGIPRPRKFANRARKEANRLANHAQRAATQSSGKVWHGAINGTPAVANVATKGR